jgi:hypothetical protein
MSGSGRVALVRESSVTWRLNSSPSVAICANIAASCSSVRRTGLSAGSCCAAARRPAGCDALSARNAS